MRINSFNLSYIRALIDDCSNDIVISDSKTRKILFIYFVDERVVKSTKIAHYPSMWFIDYI